MAPNPDAPVLAVARRTQAPGHSSSYSDAHSSRSVARSRQDSRSSESQAWHLTLGRYSSSAPTQGSGDATCLPVGRRSYTRLSWYQQSFTRGSGSGDLGAVGEIWAFDACSGDRHEGRRRKEGCGGWGAMAVAPSRWHSARGREGKWICTNWASGRLPEDDRQTERESSGTGTTEATPVAALRQAEHTRERVDPTNGASDWPEDERRKEGESSGSRATGVTPVAVLRLAGTPWAKGKLRELRRVGEGMGRAPGSYEEQTHPNVWLGGCPPLLEEQPPGELKPHRL